MLEGGWVLGGRTPKNSFFQKTFFFCASKIQEFKWGSTTIEKMAKVLASYVASWDPQKVVQEPKMGSFSKDALSSQP